MTCQETEYGYCGFFGNPGGLFCRFLVPRLQLHVNFLFRFLPKLLHLLRAQGRKLVCRFNAERAQKLPCCAK